MPEMTGRTEKQEAMYVKSIGVLKNKWNQFICGYITC